MLPALLTSAWIAPNFDQRVDRAELVDALRDQRLGAGSARHVVSVGAGLAPLLRDLGHDLAGLLEIDVVHHHRRAVLREMKAVSAPDAAAAAGHDRCAAVEKTHGALSLGVKVGKYDP
jgi:hypothetical protein